MYFIKPFIFLVIVLISFLHSTKANAQGPQKIDPMELFDAKNYIEALDGFKKLEKQFPEDVELKHSIGICYLKLYNDKALAIPYLEYCYKAGKYRNELLLELAQAYQFNYKLDDAITFYKKYIEKAPAKTIPLIEHYIETCENAKELIKKPVDVTFENVGKEINTKYADYYPFVTRDEETLFFTSRREQNTGKMRSFNGYYTSDVYTSKVERGAWTKAKNMSVIINGTEDEECVGISPDGKSLIIYVDNITFPGDLFYTELQRGKVFKRPVPFNDPVNSDFVEAEGCFADDGNTLFFVSNRPGGLGEQDIYLTRRLPNGEWGIPQNLGPNINTPYKEAFPAISEDGKTLFFSSQGHTSIGGYDVFKSRWNENSKTWETPVNIGYPINTTDDDMMFSVAKNQRNGYISAWRKEGFGDLDIYKITFNTVEQELTVIVGKVLSADTTATQPEAQITITNVKTKEEIDSKEVNKKTGKYIFVVTPGKYQLNITATGYRTIEDIITVYDKSDFTKEIIKNYKLSPIQSTP